MTHEEYLSRLDRFTDADAAAVLAHAEGCAFCRAEARRADAALSLLAPRLRSLAEEIASWVAVAAFLAIAVSGLRPEVAPPAKAAYPARYLVVGDASGVVAYTPGGVVVGIAALPSRKQVVR
jgi:hypothetical protein